MNNSSRKERFRDAPMMDDRLTSIPDTPGRRGAIGVAVREGRLLLIRRSDSVVAPRMYCFPGGGIEHEETEQEALIREFQEELGVAIRPIRPLWISISPWKVELRWWTVDIPARETITPNPMEVESFHWFTPAEISNLPDSLPSNFEFLAAWERGDFTLDGMVPNSKNG